MIKIKHAFEPLHFLHALGAGGIAISFFMYLMFMTKHPETPVPTFNSIMNAFTGGTLTTQTLIAVAVLGIIVFGLIHFTSLFHQIKGFHNHKKNSANTPIVQNTAVPLTFGMSMNVLFTFTVVFIPNAWNYIEYIFPVAIGGFLVIAFFTLRMIVRQYTEIFSKNDSQEHEYNHLSHALPVFALAMLGVGLSGPAAMTHLPLVATIALMASIGINTIATVLFVVQFVIGINHVFKKGWAFEHSPSMWIILPFLTLIGISLIRYEHAFHTVLGSPIETSTYFLITLIIISIQLFFGILGYQTMKKNGYFTKYLKTSDITAGNLSLICPGVAMVVFGFFFIHRGLVANDIVTQNSFLYIILVALFIALQIKTIKTYITIHRKLRQAK